MLYMSMCLKLRASVSSILRGAIGDFLRFCGSEEPRAPRALLPSAQCTFTMPVRMRGLICSFNGGGVYGTCHHQQARWANFCGPVPGGFCGGLSHPTRYVADIYFLSRCTILQTASIGTWCVAQSKTTPVDLFLISSQASVQQQAVPEATPFPGSSRGVNLTMNLANLLNAEDHSLGLRASARYRPARWH